MPATLPRFEHQFDADQLCVGAGRYGRAMSDHRAAYGLAPDVTGDVGAAERFARLDATD
jgi:hypothetical protein